MNLHNWADAERLKIAYALLPKDKQAVADRVFGAAHDQLLAFHRTGTATRNPSVPHQFLLAKSALTNDAHGVVNALPEPGAIEISVSPGGEIWGTGKYQQLDPGWVEAAGIWLEHFLVGKHKFPAGKPQILQMPDQVTFAIAGDWGTGGFPPNPAPAIKIKDQIPNLKADYTIHLGDVYYAGTSGEETDNLINLWPAGSAGAFTLNSNHEMYSGAKPYFTEALASPLFKLQAGYSFFALENTNWIVVGLDSAYFSNEDGAYLDGSLGTGTPDAAGQIDFLKEVAGRGKKVIVLSHHNGLQEDGSGPTTLWNQVMNAFPPDKPPAYWYWGHVHAGVVYVKQPNGVQGRCTGHAALPWGLATELQNNKNVTWFETRSANDPSDPKRVLNGYTKVRLDGASLHEEFFDENGNSAWKPEEAGAVAAT
ncbi:MAG TPA: metallophosphoesterase [Bryobacteraceae bacterium]|jgi:hypothetical protein|nr:metallophosphoesterase [Bryobacteraceae bacterium]